jgi:hypothetical protein
MELRSKALCMLTVAASALLVGGCTPTVRVEVAPINIYARLDADVRVRLDQEVQSLIQQNPNLF